MFSALVYSQYCPGHSWVHRLDPRCKWLVLFLLTASLFMLERPLVLILLALGLVMVPWSAGISRKLYLPALAGMLPLAALSLVFQAGWGPAPHWGWLSLEGLQAGGSLALRLLQLALLARIPIIPINADCDREWVFNTWDRLRLPKPFAHIKIKYGPELWVRDKEDFGPVSEQLRASLNGNPEPKHR